jgi:DNA-binding NarL/FixJ family response regulator
MLNRVGTVFSGTGHGIFTNHWGGPKGVEKQRIVIAEDHTILREGLRALLCSNPHFDVVGEAEDGLETIRCVGKLKPDIVLLDLSMPRMNGMEAIREITKLSPKTKVLVLTVHKTEEYILEAFESGAAGYCLKDATGDELTVAIRSVLSGKPYLSPGISQKILEGYLKGRKTTKPVSAWDSITLRERGILKLIGEGYTNKEIADYLCISAKTVEKHRSNIMKKLDLHSLSDLRVFAIEKGLVTK